MFKWLDTETKAMLQQALPEKFAPPDTGMFTLVLLRKGNDSARLVKALAKIPGISTAKATDFASRSCPLPVAASLSLGDAMLGQFELVCCDSISVFLRNEIVFSAEKSYLNQLYHQFQKSPEFECVTVTVVSLSDAESGKHFVDQFLGESDAVSLFVGGHAHRETMMRKKARIMAHWASKVGAEVVVADNK